ncbi:hypothetical protein BHAP_1237 [Bifidobacterium hapali]|uniref:Uncharacterized protein n=1 Tax=Bifidobacterium hapali TaxID=1630172 RepID=A0A261G006_9BIFI|nr:hypothetical protein BHAP_1237 [Bifidobacterium hapali]
MSGQTLPEWRAIAPPLVFDDIYLGLWLKRFGRLIKMLSVWIYDWMWSHAAPAECAVDAVQTYRKPAQQDSAAHTVRLSIC